MEIFFAIDMFPDFAFTTTGFAIFAFLWKRKKNSVYAILLTKHGKSLHNFSLAFKGYLSNSEYSLI